LQRSTLAQQVQQNSKLAQWTRKQDTATQLQRRCVANVGLQPFSSRKRSNAFTGVDFFGNPALDIFRNRSSNGCSCNTTTAETRIANEGKQSAMGGSYQRCLHPTTGPRFSGGLPF
jgi:hypothetical protein